MRLTVVSSHDITGLSRMIVKRSVKQCASVCFARGEDSSPQDRRTMYLFRLSALNSDSTHHDHELGSEPVRPVDAVAPRQAYSFILSAK